MFSLTGKAATIVKWITIGVIFSGLSGGTIWGIKKLEDWHNNQITIAKNEVRLELAVERQKALDAREEELKKIAEEDLVAIQIELNRERNKVDDLRRMLLIDHDLDRLLQRKPGLILPRVNKGTEEVLLELEELTK